MNHRIIAIDPAHFHAALIHKEMPSGVDPTAHVFAPLGPDLLAHLQRIADFNSRPINPTRWHLEVHARPDFLAQMLHNPPGDIVVLAGRNNTKIDTMLACVEAGLNVLADKPWIIRAADLPKLERLTQLAESKPLLVFDIMTERHEITSILQRHLFSDAAIFGDLISGTADRPAVEMRSIHAIKKTVAGSRLRRPPSFFDINLTGEGLTDVGTHLVDLSFWMIAPDQSLDFDRDIVLHLAERWPTRISRDDYIDITGRSDFPGASANQFDYWCNNRLAYSVRGHRVHLDIRWDVDLAAGDTHEAEFRGTRSVVRVSQQPDRPNVPELDVIPNDSTDQASIRSALCERIALLSNQYAGLGIDKRPGSFRITIPAQHRIGHEAHFAQVAQQFLNCLDDRSKLPIWEMPNLLAKYAVTTRGVELAHQSIE